MPSSSCRGLFVGMTPEAMAVFIGLLGMGWILFRD